LALNGMTGAALAKGLSFHSDCPATIKVRTGIASPKMLPKDLSFEFIPISNKLGL
jgi:hypothetical protein